MPNFASALKDEIVRLARKELRLETENLKKASSAHRSELAALKKRVTALEKQLGHVTKKAGKAAPVVAPDESAPVRFSPKGLAKHRKRLGLSAAEMGLLLDVSAQTVYHWEAGKTRPRQQQLAVIAVVRGMGKREAMAKLEGLAGR